MKTAKILLTIGGVFAVIILATVVTKISTNDTKKVAGVSTQNIFNLDVKILPKHNEGSLAPNIQAKAAYLIDVDTALPLYAKNEKEKLPIASTTKIATALVVLENYGDRLKDVVTITPQMINVEETTIKLRAGEKITVENLLNGLLINSGNDTAFALSQYFGGTKNFVAEMNNKVWQIGLAETQYFDPAGLNDDGRSTARDLAVLGAYALRNSKFAEIVKTPEKDIASVDGHLVHDLTNSNRLVRPEETLYLPYAIGVKTGFTYEAGHVLVSAAEKDGHRIIAVVLNTYKDTTPASAEESKKLLEWGFANWTW